MKCEFLDDINPCKRCLNGSHECVIPGRKKRRTPPYVTLYFLLAHSTNGPSALRKREHLLNQIRDQATQIQQLMEQLQIANNQKSSALSSTGSPEASWPDLLSVQKDVPVSPSDEVAQWLFEARQKLDAFEGFIGASGRTTSVTKELLVDADPEDPASDPEEVGEFEFVVEDGDDQGRADATTPSQQLAILPPETSALGTISKMALANWRRSPGVEDRAGVVGVANEEYFRPSAFSFLFFFHSEEARNDRDL